MGTSFANDFKIQAMQPDYRLKNIERISRLMDSQFKIGGFRFGLDPIINLVPFLGDGISLVISTLLVFTMRKHGASNKIMVKMALNVIVDAIIGAIPLIGWIFDFYFKANERNLRLLKEHYQEGKHVGSGKNIIWSIVIGLLVLLIVVIYLVWLLTTWLWDIVF